MVDGVYVRYADPIARFIICKGESRMISAILGDWPGWRDHRTAEDGHSCRENHVADRWSTESALMGLEE